LNLENLVYLLKAVDGASPGAKGMWAYQQLTEHMWPLWEFLESGRYKGKAIQIANAMAGIAEMTRRSSLDRGVKFACAENSVYLSQKIRAKHK